MDKLKLNNTELEIASFTRTIVFVDGKSTSSATTNLVSFDLDTIEALAQNIITSIQLYHDDTLIYELTNIHARIESLSEMLEADIVNKVLNIAFLTLDNE